MSEIRNREFRLLYLLLCGFFFSCFAFSFPNLRQIRNREFLFHITCLFAASFFCFSFSFAMRPSFTVVIRQCSVNCMQLPSPQLHLTCVLLYHIHVGESIKHYSETTKTMMEQQKSNRADGAWGRSTGKNEKILRSTTFSYAVQKCTHLGGGHRKIVYRHSEMAYINRRRREAA